ncbi:MAG: PmoA family protein [Microbacterium sp.]
MTDAAHPRAVPLTVDVGEAEAVVHAGDVEIARYVFRPDAPVVEGPKPYLHPLRTLDGAVVTGFRPWDHRWHKGLQMTWTHVSGQNFWGGPTYVDGEGYVWLDNVGSMRHERFTALDESGLDVGFTEELTWLTQAGAEWIAETRTHRFHGVDAARGLWVLDFTTTIRNISGVELELGSPTTQGRPAAGYTGFVLRMPRAWTGGTVTADGIDGADALMGRAAEWVAFSGEHDDVDGAATVVAYAGTSSAAPAIRWFVRSEPIPVMSPSPSYDEHIRLAPGDELTLSHRHVFADRAWSGEELRALARDLDPANDPQEDPR